MIHRQLCSGRDKRPKKEVTPCETLVRIADGLSYQHPFGQWRHTNCIRIFIVFDKLHCFAADSAIYGRFVLYTYMPVDRLQNVGQVWRVQDSNALQCLLILVHCICLMRGEVILELHRFILLVKKDLCPRQSIQVGFCIYLCVFLERDIHPLVPKVSF